tara:strand:+ start:1358 stop:1699 length:342 start_codon:yes stop_codon:yes gene_type:complete
MKCKTSKAKGRRLQNLVRDLLKKAFPSLREDDIKSQTMGMCGEDIVFSPAAKDKIPYSFECKNQERLQLWAALDQAKDNSEDRVPILVVKRNRTIPFAVLPLDKFMELIKEKV